MLIQATGVANGYYANPNCFEKTEAGGLFSFWSITHKPKLNELNPLLFLRIVRHCAFLNRSTDLPITANKINNKPCKEIYW